MSCLGVDVLDVADDVDVVVGRDGRGAVEAAPCTKTSPLRHPYDGAAVVDDGAVSLLAG